ncbi:ABC transporter substrate-binding protein [Azospirillum sp.]|uniref:ABC transporter substrate-binding protein n=1 Tax=Azospirillum sp. TaxID=34012 RepID=UPI002D52C4C6|nr:ABC transporter substrate-binding protein [Azospirillum sp.]HYD65783.1 ABC transporter substrate-binding protein [Azospirillum sp.]
MPLCSNRFPNRLRRMILAVLLVLAPFGTATGAWAEDLAIGFGSDVTTLDPHYQGLTPNVVLARHIFDALTRTDARLRLQPGLAERWEALNDTTWVFTLRAGVTFHDGAPLRAADVVASLKRAAQPTDSPNPHLARFAALVDARAVDDLTVFLTTKRPEPSLPALLAQLAIIPERLAGAPREAFDSGAAVVGTGPYRLVRWQRGDAIELAAFDGHWAGPPPWERVSFRVLPKPAARVAALLDGAVQVIAQVPPADALRLRQDPAVTVVSGLSGRLVYLGLDSGRDRSPFVTDRAGKPLDRNPLRDVRVRRALSKAINRTLLAEQVLEGLAIPAGQMLPDGFPGVSPRLKPDAHDPEGARRLLAAAGWPDGFGLTLHVPSDRYVNAPAVARSIGVMLSRAGVATKVEALPSSQFFPRAGRLEFSALMAGLGTNTGETSDMLVSLLATREPTRQRGQLNRGLYSNAAFDALLERAVTAMDPAERAGLLGEASDMAMQDAALLPLYHEVSTWAMRRGLSYVPRVDEFTLATEVKPERTHPLE